MNTFIKNLILLPALGANLVVVLTGTATAQTFTNLHDFGPAITNGIYPAGGLIISSNTLFGTASGGGISGRGTVFAVNTDGSSFTNLYNFTEVGQGFTNSDGAGPQAGLLLAGGALYGTTPIGGSSGNGTVFAVNTDGSGFTNLYNFSALSANTNSDGASPHAGLILSGNTLFGTAALGGSTGAGAVFRLNTDGTGFTNLYSFTATSDPLLMTNGDGAYPQAGLVLSGNILFGTTTGGGRSGNGTVFRLNTDGTAFTNLYAFTAASNSTNSDGGSPRAGLVLSGNTLYGTTFRNGISGRGTVFKVNTDGTGFMNLHSFLMPAWSCPAIPCMGRHFQAAVTAMAPCSASIRMARLLPPCILSLWWTLIPTRTAMGPFRMPAWSCPATPCMGRRRMAALRMMAQSSVF